MAAVADARKGEQLDLVTDRAKAERADLQEWARENGVPELHLPKRIVFVSEMPALGTGKLDHVAIQTLAEA